VGKDGFEPPNSEENRFTVCCRWPLDYLPRWYLFPARRVLFPFWKTPCCQLSLRGESNPRPADYKSAALPTELLRHDISPNTFIPVYKELKLTQLTACFFGKAKVSEFVKWKNFEVFFIRIASEYRPAENPDIKKPLKGVFLSGSLLIFFSFYHIN
jgi:hypothetical protein